MNAMLKRLKSIIEKIDEYKIVIFLLFAFVSLYLGYAKLGTGISFWIIALTWLIVCLIFFINPSAKLMYAFVITVLITFVFSILISFKVILNDGSVVTTTNNNTPTVGTTTDGIVLSTCTNTANDKPVMLDGWKATIYSAKLENTSPDVSKANKVRTFSYSGIKNKTDKNSLYVRVEKADGSYITGYGVAIEACDTDNKVTKSYTTADTNYTASDRVVASTHYFHGGSYLHGTGDYRVDVYVKTTDGVWHLIDRMSDIKITE